MDSHVSIIEIWQLPISSHSCFTGLFLKEENSIELLDRELYWVLSGVSSYDSIVKVIIQEVVLIGRYTDIIKYFSICLSTHFAQRPKQRTVFNQTMVFTTLTLIIGAVILLPLHLVEIFYLTSSQRVENLENGTLVVISPCLLEQQFIAYCFGIKR